MISLAKLVPLALKAGGKFPFLSSSPSRATPRLGDGSNLRPLITIFSTLADVSENSALPLKFEALAVPENKTGMGLDFIAFAVSSPAHEKFFASSVSFVLWRSTAMVSSATVCTVARYVESTSSMGAVEPARLEYKKRASDTLSFPSLKGKSIVVVAAGCEVSAI